MTSPLFAALRRLYSLGRPHRRFLFLSFACMVVVGLTTGAYAWLMGPLLQLLLTGAHPDARSQLPFLEGISADRALWLLPAVALVIGLIKGVAYLGQFFFAGWYGQRVAVDLRRRLFAKLLTLSPRQSGQELSGDLLARTTTDLAAVEFAATYTLASYFRDTVQLAVLVAVAFALAWKLAAILLFAVPLALWPALRVTGALLGQAREGQSLLGQLSAQFHEGVGAVRTLQVFNAREAELRRFERKSRSLRAALERVGWLSAATPALMELLAALSIALVIVLATGLDLAGPEQLVSFVAAVVLAYQPAKDLGRLSGYGLQAVAALERIEAVLVPPAPSPPGAVSLPPLRHGISVRAVSFEWASGRPALTGVTLEVHKGETVALVGSSGGGKSTLLSLLMAFERPSSGQVLIDGVEITQASVETVRSQFALVTQEPQLFSASIRENLTAVRPQATQEELTWALRSANALEFVQGLPQGLDTRLGERGVTLSGGERQRLCLARALVSQAPVLLLDEATRSLDATGEQVVQAAVDRVLGESGRTAIVVAHRLATVRAAHRIYVLEAGSVVESGTHTELMAQGGRYAQWVRLALNP